MSCPPPRKLDNKLECPIDNIIYKCIPHLSNIVGSTHPNTITLVSTALGLLSVYYLTKGRLILFTLLFLSYYILDILDGYHARKHNKCSKFGDYFDHIRDIIIISLVVYFTITKLYKNSSYGIIVSIILFFILFQMHMSCQELHIEHSIDKNSSCHSETLSIFNWMCKSKQYIHFTRYFGMGTFIVILCIVAVYTSIKFNKGKIL